MSGRKKRFWSDDEKREICDQATTPGISVAQVARRYAVNANLIHKWLRDPRFAPSAAPVEEILDADAFARKSPRAITRRECKPSKAKATRSDLTT